MFKSYEASYVKALNGATPSIWALHPYYAVNCEQSASITTFAAGLPATNPAPQIWFTEVGSWECRLGQTTPRGPTRQLADANYLNRLLQPPFPVLVTNTFWYELAVLGWTQNCAKYADSALYEAAQPSGPLFARPRRPPCSARIDTRRTHSFGERAQRQWRDALGKRDPGRDV